MLDEQIEAQEGVDFFIGEAFHHPGEALFCLESIKSTYGLPSMIVMSFYSSRHARESHVQGNQFDLGNTSLGSSGGGYAMRVGQLR